MNLYISYDSGTKDGDVPCLAVIRHNDVDKAFEVINIFTGAETEELYRKLGG